MRERERKREKEREKESKRVRMREIGEREGRKERDRFIILWSTFMSSIILPPLEIY